MEQPLLWLVVFKIQLDCKAIEEVWENDSSLADWQFVKDYKGAD